jgi:SPP1 gp7 family putative phage head morphogenesis protein
VPFDSYLTLDAKRDSRRARERFARSKQAEAEYARQLRLVSQQIDHLVKALRPYDEIGLAQLNATLNRYADIIRPWAHNAARRMIDEVARKDVQAWKAHARSMGVALHKELETTPIGAAVKSLMAQQVDLITSLPIAAARRVHKLVYESMVDSSRTPMLEQEIMKTGAVTQSRAKLIAFTEVGRATATLNQARAQHLGATHFIWETVRDGRVRPLHRELQGKVFAFDDLPVTGESGERSLPGAIYNCRCWARPILEF